MTRRDLLKVFIAIPATAAIVAKVSPRRYLYFGRGAAVLLHGRERVLTSSDLDAFLRANMSSDQARIREAARS